MAPLPPVPEPICLPEASSPTSESGPLRAGLRIRGACLYAVPFFLLQAWAVLPAIPVEPEPPAPVILHDASGKKIAPLADRGQKATVLFFLTTECSIGNGYAPEIARIVEDYRKSGVVCYSIYAHETAREVQQHVRDFRLGLTALLDRGLVLARRTGATVTPEACVVSPSGEVVYRGRIDDRAVKPGTVRLEPRVRDLRLALDAVIQGRPVPVKFTQAVGCYLDFPAAGGK